MLHRKNLNIDLNILDFSQIETLKTLSAKPTVCLLASDSATEPVNEVFEVLVAIGCQVFLTWGAAADAIHDRLDDLIEQKGGEYLEIATLSQKDELMDDVAWFLLNASIPGQTDVRYVVVMYPSLADVHLLRAAIHLSVATGN